MASFQDGDTLKVPHCVQTVTTEGPPNDASIIVYQTDGRTDEEVRKVAWWGCNRPVIRHDRCPVCDTETRLEGKWRTDIDCPALKALLAELGDDHSRYENEHHPLLRDVSGRLIPLGPDPWLTEAESKPMPPTDAELDCAGVLPDLPRAGSWIEATEQMMADMEQLTGESAKTWTVAQRLDEVLLLVELCGDGAHAMVNGIPRKINEESVPPHITVFMQQARTHLRALIKEITGKDA